MTCCVLRRIAVAALAFSISGLVWGSENPERAGVTLYEQALEPLLEGRADETEARLREMVADDPAHAGAWLDLAILQCSQGQRDDAERLFTLIEERFAPPPAIQEVINRQRASGCQGPEPTIYARVRVGGGWDSNVNQGASDPTFRLNSSGSLVELILAPEYRPRSDTFTALSLDLVRASHQSGAVSYAQFFGRKYESESRFDLAAVAAGTEYPGHIGSLEWRLAGALGITSLGGQRYQQQGALNLQLIPDLPLPPAWEISSTGGVTLVQYPSLRYFDAAIWELRVQAAWRQADRSLTLGAGLAFDEGEDKRPGGDRDGWFLSATGRALLFKRALGELSVTWQTWDGRSAYSQGFINDRRAQETLLVRTSATIPLTNTQALHVEYRWADNQENISLFEYSGHLVQLSWQWQRNSF